MKKFLIILCAFLFLGTEIAWAQAKHPVFSSALGGGGYGYYGWRGVRRSVYRPVAGRRDYVVAQPVKQARKKIIVKYNPNQIDLVDDQMEKLMPVVRNIQDGKVKTLEVIGICRDYNTISNRQRSLAKILRSYSPSLDLRFRQITGAAVIDSNDNTMEFVGYW